jgi:hypothetical protein
MAAFGYDPRDKAFFNSSKPGYGVGDRIYCSKDGAHTPLAAQPAEAKLCETCGSATHEQHGLGDRKPAEQPKPTAKGHDFSDPYCARRYEGAVVRLCVDCGTFETTPVRECGTVGPMWRVDFERWVGKKAAGILRDPATPERIVKPPMAHVAGSHDDDLIGCAR